MGVKEMITLNATINFPSTSFKLDNRNLKEVGINFFSKSNIEMPSYGIISNTANLSFNDYNKTIYDLIKSNQLKSNLTVVIYLINLISKHTEDKGIWYTDKWSYDNNNNQVSVTLKDDLLEWQNILVGKYHLSDEKTMYEIYSVLKEKTPSKFQIDLDIDTENFLKNTKCKYPYLKEGSLWSQYDKLCQVCGLNIYKTPQNKVKIIRRI
jgi:hypothetical protein